VRAIQIDWDGAHVPEAFRKLPPGRYIVEYVEEIDELTPEEAAGIMEALDDLDAGHFVSYEDAMREIRAGLPPG
jgi:hypothetical protein